MINNFLVLSIVIFFSIAHDSSSKYNYENKSIESKTRTHTEIQDDSLSIIYGKWKIVNYAWYPVGSLTEEKLEILKNSYLLITETQLSFFDVDFFDVCKFSKSDIKITEFFDPNNTWENSWYDENNNLIAWRKDVGPLPFLYSKNILEKFTAISFSGNQTCKFFSMYLYNDTLIIYGLDGITLFLEKIAN